MPIIIPVFCFGLIYNIYHHLYFGLRKLGLYRQETPTFLPPFSEKPATFL